MSSNQLTNLNDLITEVQPSCIFNGGSDEYYLLIALKLALKGEASTFPNPVVGSIIVYEGEHSFESKSEDNKLIAGIGYHQKYGEAHAEVNAIENAKAFFENHKDKLKGAKTDEEFFQECSIYVSLEPCDHQGQTGPCSDLIIKHKFKKVIFAAHDPNPKVAGKGIEKIIKAGIAVTKPEELDPRIIKKANYTNRAFFKYIQKQEPWITVKIASTNDGRMITSQDEPRWISNSNSRKLVHRLRSCNKKLITGINTVIQDDPEMNIRYTEAELDLYEINQPQRIILSSHKSFSEEDKTQLKIFHTNDKLKAPLEFSVKTQSKEQPKSKYYKEPAEGTIQFGKPSETTDKDFDYQDLETLVKDISKDNTAPIMIEAGPKLSAAFLENKLIDEIVHFEPIKEKTAVLDYAKRIINSYQEKYQGIIDEINIDNVFISIIQGNDGESSDICLKIPIGNYLK